MRVQNRGMRKCAFLATALLAFAATAQEDASINVALRASFDAGPYLLELLETAALENSTSYFPLLDRIAEGTFTELQSDQELYERFLEVLQQDGHCNSPEVLSSFKLALSLHAAAPRVEAHYQYYRTLVEPQMMAAQDAVCPVWVHLDGQQYCSPTLERAQQPVDMEDWDIELPFDRTLGDAAESVVSILYADITHPLFGQFHETVSGTAKEGKTLYRVRYRPASKEKTRPLYVSGYGTELVLKRTDYIVIDDRETSDSAGSASQKDGKGESKVQPDFEPLTTSELSKLGLSTASYIMSSPNPFDTLIEVSANFPKYSSVVAGANTSSEFLAEHFANRDKLLPAGFNVIWMNGLQLEHRRINAYSLLEDLRRERQLIAQFTEIGLTATQAIDLISHEVLTQAQQGDEAARYDWRDDQEGGSVVVWMNDIELDKRYAGWTSSMRGLLQRTYPGQMPQVRLNLYHLIVPIDLAEPKDLEMVTSTLQTMVQRKIPIRIGLVLTGQSDTASVGIKLSYHILHTYGIGVLMRFYQEFSTSKQSLVALQAAFEAAVKDVEVKEGASSQSFADIAASPAYDQQLTSLITYRKRLALNGEEAPILINGVALNRDDSWFDKASQRLMSDLRALQVGVYEETIAEGMNLAEYFLASAVSRRNTLIVPNDSKDINIVNVADIDARFGESIKKLPQTKAIGDSALLSDRIHILVVSDLGTDAGQQLAATAGTFHTAFPDAHILIVHNGRSLEDIPRAAVKLWTASISANLDGETIRSLAIEDGADSIATSPQELEEARAYWETYKPLVNTIGLEDGQSGLWLNGRVIAPILDDFTLEDFEALAQFESSHRIAPVTTAITGLGLEDTFTEPLKLAKVTSIIARSLKSDIPQGIYESSPPIRLNNFRRWDEKHSLIHSPASSEASIQIVASIDPASELAQPWIPLLKMLSELEGIDVKIFVNPKSSLEELPIKRFYSQVVSSKPSFKSDGSLSIPGATFNGVPKQTLFNLGMVVPPSWLVAPKESVYDLDNIKLSSVPAGKNVDAIYELEHILIEGHSRDTTRGSPPRGVQLMLGTEKVPHFADTIIMANLGYFQFKANPGYWQISLKPGRSSNIYNIDSIGAKGYAAQPGDETTSIALMSFQGVTLYPRLSRKAGMEAEEVLEASSGSAMDYLGKGASFASSAWSSLGLGKTKAGENAEINIFSVASGHLYERMLNIMMVSVMRHTKHTVKFWFIEQFLSPSFKSSLPHMAAHYKFKYEMVTYKWPHWLRGQKEKQREIWGYKILFLDVLFPLNLDKVIFVDADQVVRTDMMELNKVDLEGAPYGFTPMCDSRTEMEGFRFWKQGYWKKFLNGKPYHISALYVVDLKKFREVAAGDRLRGQYQGLSADPASLANLDQDLPNHMQHMLPIHSLSQEWLWCETWCSDESLKKARTIDLCNNPQTKEPKLDRARRQVPEWTEYDEEIAEVLRKAKGDAGLNSSENLNVQEAEQKILHDSKRPDEHIKDEL